MRNLKCSFCGKQDTEVARLLAGTGGRGSRPRAYICDKCIKAATKIVSDEKSSNTVTPLK